MKFTQSFWSRPALFLSSVLFVLRLFSTPKLPAAPNVSKRKKARLNVSLNPPQANMKISAYQAAMLSMGQPVDDLSIKHMGDWTEDSDHMFRNIIFQNFVGELFNLEHIVDENGNLARPWEKEVECFAVKAMVSEDGVVYAELEDEEPLQ
jgi:hypothetical protein